MLIVLPPGGRAVAPARSHLPPIRHVFVLVLENESRSSTFGPHSHVQAGSWGTMGYALPAALGAAMAFPGRKVVALAGDASFLMSSSDLVTATNSAIWWHSRSTAALCGKLSCLTSRL